MLSTIDTSAKLQKKAEDFQVYTEKSHENNPGGVRRDRFKKNQGVKPRNSHALACCFIVVVAVLMAPLASCFKDCGPDQIKYINKTTGQIDHCMDCPPCIASQQYSILCGSTVDTGKLGTCMDCPDETYTDSFGTKPCQPCTTCTNRKYLQKCTKSQNAKCGDCLDGFKEDLIIFACKKDPSSKNKQITKTTEKITQAPTAVTTTPSTTARLKSSTPNIKKYTKPAIRNRTLPKTSNTNSSHTSAFPTLLISNSQEGSPTSSEKSESLKNWIVVGVIAPLLVCCIMIFGVVFYFVRIRKRNSRWSKEEGNQEENVPLKDMTNTKKDRPLKFFVDNGGDVWDSVCAHLNSYRHGKYECERMANRFLLTHTECLELRNMAMSPHENATQGLLEILCTRKPNLTVKQFATMAKHINRKDVHDMLEPFFEELEMPPSLRAAE